MEFLEQKDLFSNSDYKLSLSSLYWRASVLWQTQNFEQADFYLSKHRDYIEFGSYQHAHNDSVNGLLNIIKLANENTSSNRYLIEKSFDMLAQSVIKYREIENFKWLSKCTISTLLMMALIDYCAKQPIKFYRKIFYVRKLFSIYNLEYTDEATSEIVSVITKVVPEVFDILFSRNFTRFIQNHALADLLKETYLEIEYELIDITSHQMIDISNLYTSLVFL